MRRHRLVWPTVVRLHSGLMLVSSRLTMHQGLTPGPEVDKLRLDGQAVEAAPVHRCRCRGGEEVAASVASNQPCQKLVTKKNG